ncbi:hypothetical protein CEXT_693461 [Caerostris extrusa]|uniref:Uncharacterized protein n=1 Tax=Caerostris extrusa TaxID=172846 RepID=A0AAV4MCY1_CAEEX|nr:hypothetical protein CEXT_693461 [Caerostris extrusa]
MELRFLEAFGHSFPSNQDIPDFEYKVFEIALSESQVGVSRPILSTFPPENGKITFPNFTPSQPASRLIFFVPLPPEALLKRGKLLFPNFTPSQPVSRLIFFVPLLPEALLQVSNSRCRLSSSVGVEFVMSFMVIRRRRAKVG